MLRSLRIENFVLIREADLAFSPGLNAVTGETGAGKTILAQAIGLLLGARGDAGYVGPGASEAYVEAELDLPDAVLDDPALETLSELRPEGEPGLVAARRVFVDGRTRAYAWGRSVPREELAALVERLLAMSGQFEQRRLAQPSFQLDVLDAFAGDEQLRRRAELARAWRGYTAARRRAEEAERDAAGDADRLAELAELVARTEEFAAGDETRLRVERDRLRNVSELADAAAGAAEALAPETADLPGAAELAARAGAALGPVAPLAPELDAVARELGEAELRLRDAASTVRAYLASLEAEPARLEDVEAALDRIADAKRRFRADSYEDLLVRAAAAEAEIAAASGGADPVSAARAALAEAKRRVDELAADLARMRREAAPALADEVRSALAALAMGGGEFRVDLGERAPGPTGADEVAFLIRPNAGLPFGPVAETASGGELSRIALALRTVAHAGVGEPTVVFDEIDAGIGGETAHAVAESLRSLADRHFRVEKVPGDPTHTRIERLDEADRRNELQRMLGGEEFAVLARREDG